MKKTIFDLSNEEYNKLNDELSQTTHYKRYAKIVGLTTIIFISLTLITILIATIENTETSIVFTNFIILVGFSFLYLLSFWNKKTDLLKKYYETKKEK